MQRRTFLAGGLTAGAAAIGASGVPLLGAGARAETSDPALVGGRVRAAASAAPGAPTGLTVNGWAAPVGVDPDDVQFAWLVTDPTPGARQRRWRVTVRSAAGEVVWDSGGVDGARQTNVVYAGPALSSDTAYSWTVATAGADGTFAAASPSAAFVTGLRASDWPASARWIGPGPAAPPLESYTYVRRSVALAPGTIVRATCYVAAAHKYQLWVNGAKVDTGPSFSYPDESYVQATDVTAAVTAGRTNGIGALHHWYGPGQGRPASAPGLLALLSVHYAGGATPDLMATDAAWRTAPAEWQPAPQRNSDGGDYVEWIDGRLHPEHWSDGSFDDGAWAAAVELGPVGTPPFTRLYAERSRVTESALAPRSVRTLSDGAVVADFGAVVAARPTVRFRHGVAGRPLPMRVGYVLDPDGHVSSTHATQGTDLAFQYVQSGVAEAGERFDPFTFIGFRYLQVDDPGEPLDGDAITAWTRHAATPRTSPAAFSSSDAVLDAVYALCAHSALSTSHEQFVDTPTREKGQFLWDACNESQTMMAAFGAHDLTWQALRDFARSQARYWPDGRVNAVYPNGDGARHFPTFTALYPEWVWRYYAVTGDVTAARTLAPVVGRVADYFGRAVSARTGLVTGLLSSAPEDNSYGYDFDTEVDSGVNILAANVFARVAAALATVTGDAAGAAANQRRAAALVAAITAHLTRADGVYVDGLRADGSPSPHASQQANAQALAYGVVPAARVGAVAEYVASLGISVEPDHGLELLRGLHAAGRDTDMLRLLTDADTPGWAAILRAGGTFTWETWTPNDVIGDSMSHGWGSAALVGIVEGALGATPLPPDPDVPVGALVDVSPPAGILTRCAGEALTAAGPVAVGWKRSGGGLDVTLTIPPNAAARLRLRAPAPSAVTVGGRPAAGVPGIDLVGSAAGVVTLLVGAGGYEISAPG